MIPAARRSVFLIKSFSIDWAAILSAARGTRRSTPFSSRYRPHHFFDFVLIFWPVFGSVTMTGFLYKLAILALQMYEKTLPLSHVCSYPPKAQGPAGGFPHFGKYRYVGPTVPPGFCVICVIASSRGSSFSIPHRLASFRIAVLMT